MDAVLNAPALNFRRNQSPRGLRTSDSFWLDTMSSSSSSILDRWTPLFSALACGPAVIRCDDSAAGASEAKDKDREMKECRRCENWRDELVRESPIVRFMLSHISLLPSTSPSTSATPSSLPLPITCAPCGPSMAGGFSPDLGVLLCQNRFMSKKHMEDALAHELVHAWDTRRFDLTQGGRKGWGEDLRAHACTEIRAENLSGDCRWGREITRRNFGFTKQHQACVRRRAILSVAANPNCKDPEMAERVVNEVWESCWTDTRPFDEIY